MRARVAATVRDQVRAAIQRVIDEEIEDALGVGEQIRFARSYVSVDTVAGTASCSNTSSATPTFQDSAMN